MDKKFKECMKPHYIAHSVSGLGIGLILVGLIPALSGGTALTLGVVAFVIGFVYDYSVNKG